jgi:hypothetical protein
VGVDLGEHFLRLLLDDFHRVDAGHPAQRRLLLAREVCPTSPAVEEVATTSPERCRRITGSTARVMFIGPNRLA